VREPVLALLLKQRARLLWNRLAKGPRRIRRLIGTGLALVFTVAFVVLAGLNAGILVERVARIDPVAATDALPVLLLGVTVITLVTSLSSAFHHLFLAGDLELLLVAPVPLRSLFWLKILEIWRDSVHVLLFQGAALFGFGQSLHLPPAYYLFAMLVGLGLTLAATALGAMLTLALARVRLGDSILGLSRVVAILLFLPIGVLGVPALGFGRNRFSLLLGQDNVQAAANTLRAIGPPPAWAPTTWAAHVLLADEAAWLSLGLLVTAGLGLFAATQLAFEGLFQGGWERVRFAGPNRGRSARVSRRLLLPGTGVPAGPIIGLLQKDWRTLTRDPRWRTGALVTLIALALPATMVIFASDPFARTGHALRFWFSMLPVPYLAYLFGSQQGGATLAYEGRNIVLLRAAPVGMGRVLLAKVLGGLIMVTIVTWAATLALALSHAGEPLEIGAALLAATWLALGATIAAVAGAALTIDFEGDNPQRRIGCLGTIVTSGLSVFFFVSNTGLLAWWVTRAALSVPRPLLAFLPIVDWGLPVFALASVAAIVLAARLGMHRLATWEAS
jgi:ABC-2 type transport system permease protein